ncbi:hypothetical protein GGR51DRAFT_556237 [Nemania sp. FL0031]|nr:hypothetical protein GGR51DRAFT_556237 [Nemania sp. FL0031]
MGRTEPTVVKPPAAFRRDARAKRARATINKVIPALLSAHPRARRGIEGSELILDPPPVHQLGVEQGQGKKKAVEQYARTDDGKETRKRRRQKRHDLHDEPPQSRNEKSNAHRDRVRRNTSTTNDEHGSRNSSVHGLRIRLCVADTLTAAHSLLHPEAPPPGTADVVKALGKVGILNMASPLSPGGGFLNGATSQEESLCMRTTLLPALRDEFYRLPELGVIYTPDVLVFRSSSSSSSSPSSHYSQSRQSAENETEIGLTGGGGGSSSTSILPDGDHDILPKSDRWFVDVASAAMLRLPETEDGRYANAADREWAARKMRAVLRVFATRGCSRIILGAWGCGAYGNPVCEVAAAWRRVLCPGFPRVGERGATAARGEGKEDATGKDKKKSRARENKEDWGAFIDEVVFAIKDASLAAAFSRAFGEDLLPLPPPPGYGGHGGGGGSMSSTPGDGDEDSVEAARVSELRGKIAQLEIQVEQARSPHLKVGLETVLVTLRKQLPSEGDNDASSISESEQSNEADDDSGDDERY